MPGKPSPSPNSSRKQSVSGGSRRSRSCQASSIRVFTNAASGLVVRENTRSAMGDSASHSAKPRKAPLRIATKSPASARNVGGK
jgi:hypothetical protein